MVAIKQKAQEHASNLRSILEDVRIKGIIKTWSEAMKLNGARNPSAARGGEWPPTTFAEAY